ncbi:MAG: metal-sulfur cluster assembly factor [Burkholderiales bacterium]|nr:metal-sulfur cluster assembly factor [Burkholderiales bacterium]
MVIPGEAQLLEALREVNDPEVGVNIVDLGLVYGIEPLAAEGGAARVRVRMTMTSRACPLGDWLADGVRAALRARFPEIAEVEVAWVWEPPWTPERMSAQARARFGWRR